MENKTPTQAEHRSKNFIFYETIENTWLETKIKGIDKIRRYGRVTNTEVICFNF